MKYLVRGPIVATLLLLISSLRPASKEYLGNRPTVLRFVESDFSLFYCLKFPFEVVKFSGWCVTKQKVFCFPNLICKMVQVLYFELVISIALTNHEFRRCSFHVVFHVSIIVTLRRLCVLFILIICSEGAYKPLFAL